MLLYFIQQKIILFVPDLGIDKVVGYNFDPTTGKLSPNSGLEIEKGQGPRHFVFHPSGNFAYVINELKSSITACKFDHQTGHLEAFQYISTLPQNFSGTSTYASIQITSNGKFLYGSNRGHDSLAVFLVWRWSLGTCWTLQHWKEKLLVIFELIHWGFNQNTDNIHSFKINQQTGELIYTNKEFSTPTPVCIQFKKF